MLLALGLRARAQRDQAGRGAPARAAVLAVPPEAGRRAARPDDRSLGPRAARRQRVDPPDHDAVVQPAGHRRPHLGQRDRQHVLSRSRSRGRGAGGAARRRRAGAGAAVGRPRRAEGVGLCAGHGRPRRHGRDLPPPAGRGRQERGRPGRRAAVAVAAVRAPARVVGSAGRRRSPAAAPTPRRTSRSTDGGELVRAGVLVRDGSRQADRRGHRQRLPLGRSRAARAPHRGSVRGLQPAARS